MRIILSGLTRTGSTNLLKAINTHRQTRCIFEPFHPKRHNGQYQQRMMEHADDPDAVLDDLWAEWNVMKHVTEPLHGWPFRDRAELNLQILESATYVIALERKDYLSRYLSEHLAKSIGFWIGTAAKFRESLPDGQLAAIDMDHARRVIDSDMAWVRRRNAYLASYGIPHTIVRYEDLFDQRSDPWRSYEKLRGLFLAMGLPEQTFEDFKDSAWTYFDAGHYRWGTEEVHARIPNLLDFQRTFACEYWDHSSVG